MSESLIAAVEVSLESASLPERDQAAAELLRRYARIIDAASDRDTLEKIGPKVQSLLTALGLTPAGRTTQTPRGGAKDDPGAASAVTDPDRALAELLAGSAVPAGFDVSAYLDPSVTAADA